jgi:Type II secretion system (T2SS), protein E, N-terminal domain
MTTGGRRWADESVPMDYRYLETSGFVNEARLTAGGHGRSSASAWRNRERGGKKPPIWRGKPIPRAVCELMPESLARENRAFPVGEQGETLLVAAVAHGEVALKDRLSFVLCRPVRLIAASREEVEALVAEYYGGAAGTESVDSMLQEFTDEAATMSGVRHSDLAPRYDPSVLAAGPRQGSRGRAFGHGGSDTEGITRSGLDRTAHVGDTGVWFYVVEEGQHVLVRNPDGTMDVLEGPRRVWRGRRSFRPMVHHIAHPGDYLVVRYRDGRQEHLPGPAEVWFDPRIHQEVSCEEMLQVPAKEAVVVYSQKEGTSNVQRRVEYGPTLFMPRPGEWLHRFVWHASEGGSQGVKKIPKGLVFHKLWLMPDQMYHDVTDVRTADDAVLTIRLMIFFELQEIATMLETTHDPIGDFVNAATSDVVDFTGRHDFESFKHNTDKLNELETYRQLAVRASQCGYRINKVVYRGYGAPDRLQQMHDQAIEARTKLQLERATEQQAQDLENFKLESQMHRAGKRRHEQTAEVAHQLELDQKKHEAELRARESLAAFQREQQRLDAQSRVEHRIRQDQHLREHLAELHRMGVDLTAYLTQNRADRVIELRGSQGGAAHFHLDPSNLADGSRSRSDGSGDT